MTNTNITVTTGQNSSKGELLWLEQVLCLEKGQWDEGLFRTPITPARSIKKVRNLGEIKTERDKTGTCRYTDARCAMRKVDDRWETMTVHQIEKKNTPWYFETR